jgi:hypothetical protein
LAACCRRFSRAAGRSVRNRPPLCSSRTPVVDERERAQRTRTRTQAGTAHSHSTHRECHRHRHRHHRRPHRRRHHLCNHRHVTTNHSEQFHSWLAACSRHVTRSAARPRTRSQDARTPARHAHRLDDLEALLVLDDGLVARPQHPPQLVVAVAHEHRLFHNLPARVIRHAQVVTNYRSSDEQVSDAPSPTAPPNTNGRACRPCAKPITFRGCALRKTACNRAFS